MEQKQRYILRLSRGDKKTYDNLSTHARTNKGLSLAAKGLLWELLGNSDDWRPHMTTMVGNSSDKKFSYRNALTELEAHGYAMSVSTSGNNRSVSLVVAEHPSLIRTFQKENPELADAYFKQAVSRKKPVKFVFDIPTTTEKYEEDVPF